MWKVIAIVGLTALVAGCSEIEPIPMEPSQGHISTEQQPAGEIPELVEQVPVLPAPEPQVELERYTVVVNEVPVKELLFALARDAQINVDIDPAIDGVVTINAVEQTLPQILKRISRQVDLRYEFEGDNLFIMPDEPFFRTYKIDYINLSRDTASTNAVATSLETTSVSGGEGGGGAFTGNNATLDVTSEAEHHLWENIANNILAILGEKPKSSGTGITITESVIPIPEAGVMTVLATSSQHKQIREFLDLTLANARRQVLIQATIVEVRLNNIYQAGIDWSFLNNELVKAGINITSATLGAVPVGIATALTIATEENQSLVPAREESLTATVRLLNEFGDVRVMSSPQLMALNNQTAILKRVENRVFFTFESETITPTVGVPTQTIDTTIHSLPIGIVMTITPHIAENEEIMLLVRPSISRETGIERTIPVPDNVTIPAGTINVIPETVTQEMESLIRLNSGEIAVLGGLMEDTFTDGDNTIPGASDVPVLGNLFTTRDREFSKIEIVVFIRPLIINNPSLDGDLVDYKQFLDVSTKDINSMKPKSKFKRMMESGTEQ